jgi:membrane protein YdbS with pleckstrin-like domain
MNFVFNIKVNFCLANYMTRSSKTVIYSYVIILYFALVFYIIVDPGALRYSD